MSRSTASDQAADRFQGERNERAGEDFGGES